MEVDQKRKFSSQSGPIYSEKPPHQQRGLCCCFPHHSSVFFRNNNTSLGCSSSTKRRAEDVVNNKVISVVGGGDSNHKRAETSRRPEARSGLPQHRIELGLEETMAEMIVAERKGGEEVQRGREEIQHQENPSPTCYNSNQEQQPVMGLAESSHVDAGAAKKEPDLIDLASEESCAEEKDEVIMDREKDKGGVLISKYDLKRCPVIRECSSACACDESCKNRVCQKGIIYRMEIFKIPHMGWGGRAAEHIPKQVFLAEYAGEMLEAGKDVEDRGEDDDSYLFEMDESIVYSVDGRRKGNVSRFFNRSCRPTLHQALSVQCGDEKEGVFHSAFFTTRTVRKGENLTLDYSDKYCFPKGKEGIFCKCGARKCRYSRERIPCLCGAVREESGCGREEESEGLLEDVEIAIKQSLLPQNE